MNLDFVEMLSALSAAEAEYLVVGAHALAAHGRVRSTGDLDIFVRPSPENARRVMSALQAFRAPLHDLRLTDLATPGVVFQIGLPPCRIDLLTAIDGVEFEAAWNGRETIRVDDMQVPVIGRAELLINKKAAGRPQDLADAAWLESSES